MLAMAMGHIRISMQNCVSCSNTTSVNSCLISYFAYYGWEILKFLCAIIVKQESHDYCNYCFHSIFTEADKHVKLFLNLCKNGYNK